MNYWKTLRRLFYAWNIYEHNLQYRLVGALSIFCKYRYSFDRCHMVWTTLKYSLGIYRIQFFSCDIINKCQTWTFMVSLGSTCGTPKFLLYFFPFLDILNLQRNVRKLWMYLYPSCTSFSDSWSFQIHGEIKSFTLWYNFLLH